MLPSLNLLCIKFVFAKNNLIRSANQYMFVSVKLAKRHPTSTEQKGVGRQHGKVQEVCRSKKMESRCLFLILSLILAHSNTSFRKVTAYYNKTCLVTFHITAIWQPLAKKNPWCHHNCCRLAFTIRFTASAALVVVSLSVLVRHSWPSTAPSLEKMLGFFICGGLAVLSHHVSVFCSGVRFEPGILAASGLWITLIDVYFHV